ncbi:oligosaccharide flippase family protein [Paraburkholderia sabiae]|jgi:PST family polysaccharide transporter|uniref:Oligosaccharide flippase family protein n=1 Tax=Paraburkholderia sabiae TaxID=273251 RepID=A0ABU9QNZ4_9BURK|nr:oligosaccharide flippase family protein [Paraburkholderia sabiae]WJZ72961.1 oligosaccharide flippase family protein [Paraburkholderia sabiae]CAD6562317.1 Putative O-antigen transporter [Paraburkholderia sabiae]CAG9193227.1 Membrane protein involved in the export of O-antigen, teichoic acid lipoteichoic acids [Paraburkholderia sabiae]
MDQVKPSKTRAELVATYFAYVVRYVYPLLLLPFYGRTLGPAGYGVVLAGMSLSNTLWRFVNFGFPTVGGRDTVYAKDGTERAAILSSHMTGRLLLCIPTAVFGLGAVAFSPVLSAHPMLGCTTVLLGLLAAFNPGWYFTSTGRARTSILIEVVGFVTSLALIFLFIRDPSDLSLVFFLLLASCVLQTVLGYGVIRREFAGWFSSIKAGIDLIQRSKVIFIYTGTSVLLITASTYLLSVLAPAAEVGAFGVAERLIAVALSLTVPASQILIPKVTYLVGQDPAKANRLAYGILAFFLFGSLVGVALTMLLADWVVPLVFGKGFQSSVPVLKVFVLVLPLSVVNQTLGLYFLIPRHRDGMLARAGVATAVVSIVAAIPLASHWGAMGMVAARLLGELTLLATLLVSLIRSGLIAEMLATGSTPLFALRPRGKG